MPSGVSSDGWCRASDVWELAVNKDDDEAAVAALDEPVTDAEVDGEAADDEPMVAAADKADDEAKEGDVAAEVGDVDEVLDGAATGAEDDEVGGCS